MAGQEPEMALRPVDEQYDPGVHRVADVRPLVAHTEPAGQGVAAELPAEQYVDAIHCNCCADDEPAGHAKPPWQAPETALKLEVAQYEPAVHGVAEAIPLVAQNEPISHAVATELPAGQYVFSKHFDCCADEDPAVHAKPPSQVPDTALKLEAAQYAPAVHGVAADMPFDAQNEPISHAVATELPAGQ